MRSYFPNNFRNMIVIAAVIIVILLLLLAFVIIYLLVKSITNNLAYSLAIVLSNGFSLRNVTLSCVANAAFIAIPAAALAYVISYFLQGALLSIFTPLIFTPIAILPFNLFIYFGLLLLSLLIVCGSFASIIIKKFKGSPAYVMSHQETTKSSK